MLEPTLLIGCRSVILLEPGPYMCPFCGVDIQIGDFPACSGDPSRHGPPRAHRIFPAFEHEGQMVNSIQDAGRIERASEDRARNEEGQAPIRFRAFHQDQSNYDVNTFGRSPQIPTPKRENIRGGFSQEARDRTVHPVVKRLRGD